MFACGRRPDRATREDFSDPGRGRATRISAFLAALIIGFFSAGCERSQPEISPAAHTNSSINPNPDASAQPDARNSDPAPEPINAAYASGPADGSPLHPLRIVLLPGDGDREAYEPLFQAITQVSGLHFQFRHSSSYQDAIESIARNEIEIAYLGPLTYDAARKRGLVELWGVGVRHGQTPYYGCLICRSESDFKDILDVKGARVAFADIRSTSGFHAPLTLFQKAGFDPLTDFAAVVIAEGHAGALALLAAKKTDVACVAMDNFENEVRFGKIDPREVTLLAKTAPIPFPPLTYRSTLDPALKQRLRNALGTLHTRKDIPPDSLRGNAGKRIDYFDVKLSQDAYDAAVNAVPQIPESLINAIQKRAKPE